MRTQLQRYLLVLIPILLLMGVGCWLVWRLLYGPGDLLEAAERGEMRKTALLTYLGVSPDSDILLVGGLMHCAAAKGETQAMARLLELGANVNRLDETGATPAHAAVFGRNLESLRWLFAHGADPWIRDRGGLAVADYVTNRLSEPEQEKFLSVIRTASNQQGGANGRQPFSSETNRTSAAAASRRSP